MKTTPIFVHTPPEDGLLHSMVYPEVAWGGKSVLNWYREFWGDAEKVRDFFEEHSQLLETPFWKNLQMTRAKAGRQVYEESKEFFFKLHDIHESFEETKSTSIVHDLFTLLHEQERGKAPFRYKAYPRDKRYCPMLRLYGIKLDSGQMLITGGGIKLTETMQQMPLLKAELDRIDQIKLYIQENNITCIEDFLLE